ncbi:hypothetical protein Y032_0003g1452 [Ancylostoma ceylanicum]|nr:hypothetical protein Y032_0003g1452 [Ancylostoma ceylanicum]
MACSAAAEFIAYTPQRIVMFIQIFFCICSIIFNLLFIYYCRKDLFFHKNCRVLIWALIATNIVHSAIVGAIQGMQLVQMFTVTDPCDMLMSAVLCYSLRLPTLVCFGSHLTIHLSVVAERAIALRYLSSYESSSSTLGFVLAVFSITSSFALTIYGTKNYNFTGRMFYCTAATKSTLLDISATSYFVVAVEAIIILLFGCVYHLSLKKSVVYDLRSKYQAKENLTVVRLLMPMLLFHFLIFFCFVLSYATSYSIRRLFPSDSAFRAYLAAIYIVPIYTACSPLLMGWILRRHRLSRTQALIRISSKTECVNDIYFSNYAWNIK